MADALPTTLCMMCNVGVAHQNLHNHYLTAHEVPQCYADSGSGKFTWVIYLDPPNEDGVLLNFDDQNILLQSGEVDYFVYIADLGPAHKQFSISVQIFHPEEARDYTATTKLRLGGEEFKKTCNIYPMDGERHSLDGFLIPYEITELKYPFTTEIKIKMKIKRSYHGDV